MNYQNLALELLVNMQAVRKAQHQNNIIDVLQGEALALHCIEEHCQNTVVPGDISKTIGVSSARVATLLNDLENKGLVTREIDRNDRRKIIVKLTTQGQNVAKTKKQEFLQKITSLLMLLGEYDAKEYVRIMGRLAEEISKINIAFIHSERVENA